MINSHSRAPASALAAVGSPITPVSLIAAKFISRSHSNGRIVGRAISSRRTDSGRSSIQIDVANESA